MQITKLRGILTADIEMPICKDVLSWNLRIACLTSKSFTNMPHGGGELQNALCSVAIPIQRWGLVASLWKSFIDIAHNTSYWFGYKNMILFPDNPFYCLHFRLDYNQIGYFCIVDLFFFMDFLALKKLHFCRNFNFSFNIFTESNG